MENKSIYEKIQGGEYETTLPYVSNRMDSKGHKAYLADHYRLREQFKTDALVELALLKVSSNGSIRFKHPKADLLWEKAWDRGHSGGLAEVWGELQDLSELLADS